MSRPQFQLPDSCARCGSQVERPGLHLCSFCSMDASPACQAARTPSVAPAAVARSVPVERRELEESPESAEVTLQLSLQDLRRRNPHLVHPDQAAVRRFCEAMEAKMALARSKGRRGWQDCSTSDLQELLRGHLLKGDPVDVANFCMMLWERRKPVVAP